MKKTTGPLLLFMAALIWGVAFVAQSSAADSIEPFTFNAVRSALAVVFLAAVIGIRGLGHKSTPPAAARTSRSRTLFGGAMCGLALFLAVNLQQFGITAYPDGAAAAGRAGFLTATYVVMVALFTLFTGKKLSSAVLLAVVVCISGMYMLCVAGGISGVYLGDILILLGAVAFAGHILTVDHFAQLDGLQLSCIQFVVCGLLSLLAMLGLEKPELDLILQAWLPLLYVGILSSGVGYTLQIIGQKYAEPTVASIVISLESVFAALAGWAILREYLSINELIGCGLVFAAVILAQIPTFKSAPAPAKKARRRHAKASGERR